jgi:beta-N-acetylhexosaminidase
VSGAARRRAVARRRRNALLAVAAVAAGIGAAVGARVGGEEEAPVAAETPPQCPPAIASEPRRLVGQMLVVRMQGEATDELLGLARGGELGGVIVFAPTGIAPAVLADQIRRLRRAASRAGYPEPLVAIDQEGGDVKRLPAEPPDISPAQLAGSGGAEAAEGQGLVTGKALARIGIDVDLAPVLDLGAEGSFVAERSFGEDPGQVSELALAFADGLGQAGVAATAKHFPGLGLATVNTDTTPSSVDASRRELEPSLEPFRAAIAASIPLIMIANATYPAYDPELPASLSARVVTGLLRRELGYDGVVITDDLGAGALTAAGLDEGEAAVAAVSAGADLALTALSDGSQARAALVRAARRGELARGALTDSCLRLIALRDRLAASPTGAR